MKKTLIYTSVVLLVVGCTLFPNYDLVGMFHHSSPDSNARFEQSMEYNATHPYASVAVLDSTYHVYVGTDSHIDSINANTCRFMADYKADASCPVALFLGDMINANHHYDMFLSAMKTLPATPVVGKRDTIFFTAGNHDIYFGQWTEFAQYFHTSSYWFETTYAGHALDLFICLDSSSGNLGRKQIKWLRELLEQKAGLYRHIIVYTHTHMFKQDATQGHTSNYPMEETTELTGMFTKYGVDMFWSGHDHSREVTTFGGVTYIIVDAMEEHYPNPFYMLVNMSNQIEYQFVTAD